VAERVEILQIQGAQGAQGGLILALMVAEMAAQVLVVAPVWVVQAVLVVIQVTVGMALVLLPDGWHLLALVVAVAVAVFTTAVLMFLGLAVAVVV
jgi:hypothetical protein